MEMITAKLHKGVTRISARICSAPTYLLTDWIETKVSHKTRKFLENNTYNVSHSDAVSFLQSSSSSQPNNFIQVRSE